MTTPKHSVSVAGVVFDDQGRVLVIKRRDNGEWQIPGGVLELGETFEEGVRREVLEETGVEIEVERLTGVYKNMVRGVVALVFRCHPVAGEPRATDECVAAEWQTSDQAMTAMSPAFSVRILDATALRSTSTRTHDGVNLQEHGPGDKV